MAAYWHVCSILASLGNGGSSDGLRCGVEDLAELGDRFGGDVQRGGDGAHDFMRTAWAVRFLSGICIDLVRDHARLTSAGKTSGP